MRQPTNKIRLTPLFQFFLLFVVLSFILCANKERFLACQNFFKNHKTIFLLKSCTNDRPLYFHLALQGPGRHQAGTGYRDDFARPIPPIPKQKPYEKPHFLAPGSSMAACAFLREITRKDPVFSDRVLVKGSFSKRCYVQIGWFQASSR